MAVAFINYKSGDVFKTVPSAGTLVSVDFLNSVVTTDNLCLYTSVSVSVNEIIQYFVTFDDLINYFHFGKGVGAVQLQGEIYCDCTGNLGGFNSLINALNGSRGKIVNFSMLTYSATCVMSECNFVLVAEPDTMIQFGIRLDIISDSRQ